MGVEKESHAERSRPGDFRRSVWSRPQQAGRRDMPIEGAARNAGEKLMAFINIHTKEITFKIVYYGPGMSGKTSNLVYIHRVLAKDRRGELVMLNTEQERTLFFDFFPIELGRVQGYQVRFNMYTVPGQVFYEASRRLVLDGADGVVFVADSHRERLEENFESFQMMQENLRSYDQVPPQFPMVLQYNKRDGADLIPLGALERRFHLDGIPVFEAVAINGRGVLPTVRQITQIVVQKFDLGGP